MCNIVGVRASGSSGQQDSGVQDMRCEIDIVDRGIDRGESSWQSLILVAI